MFVKVRSAVDAFGEVKIALGEEYGATSSEACRRRSEAYLFI